MGLGGTPHPALTIVSERLAVRGKSLSTEKRNRKRQGHDQGHGYSATPSLEGVGIVYGPYRTAIFTMFVEMSVSH